MATPTVTITQENAAAGAALVAPFVLVLECTSASTHGDTRWDECLIRWTIVNTAGTAAEDRTVTDPVTGASRTLFSDQYGPCCMVPVLEGQSGTITVTATVTNGLGESANDQITISDSGTPDISYSIRADAKRYRISSGGSDGSPTGTGTAADPLHYRTLGAAFAAASGADNVFELERGEVHDATGGAIQLPGSNAVLRARAGGAALPRLQLSAKLWAASTTHNQLLQLVELDPVGAGGAEVPEAVDFQGGGWCLDRVGTPRSLVGTSTLFSNTVANGDNQKGYSFLEPAFGEAQDNQHPPKGNGFCVFGGSIAKTEDDWVFRWLGPDGDRTQPSRRFSISYLTVDRTGTATPEKGIRLQQTDVGGFTNCRFIQVSVDLSWGTQSLSRDVRFDGCWFTSSNNTLGIIRTIQRGNHHKIVNCIFDFAFEAGKVFGKADNSGDNTTTAVDGIHFACCTVKLGASRRFVSIGEIPTPVYQITGLKFDANLIVANTGHTGFFFSLETADTVDTAQDNILPDVAGSRAIAERDAVDYFRTDSPTWDSLTSDPNVNGTTQFYDYSPGSLTLASAWRPTVGPAVTGATTPKGVHHDVHHNARGATSYIGAADAASGGGGDPPPVVSTPEVLFAVGRG